MNKHQSILAERKLNLARNTKELPNGSDHCARNTGGKTHQKKRKYVSLFSGAMGLDIGLERAGFECVVCNEIDPLAIETIRLNKPKLPVIATAVENVSHKILSEAAGFDVRGLDLLVGGPPCQAFSVFGQRRGLRDGRGRLIFEFQRLVKEVRPKTFLMENVRGLHSMPLVTKDARLENADIPPEHEKAGSLLQELVHSFQEIGYRVDCYLVNSANYGAPQIRERLLCIGNLYNLDVNFPPPQFSNRPSDRLPPFRTLRDAIGNGFVDPDSSMMNFSPRKLKYLSMVPPGGNWRSLPVEIQKESMGKSWYLKGGRSAYWRKLSFDFPCPTVVTMPNHAGTSMCHPTELRALTVGEMAAVQEFPPDWKFSGTPTDKCRQIGNAVPPRLGCVAGEALKVLLGKIDSTASLAYTKPSPSRTVHLRPHVRTRSYFKDGEAKHGNISYYDTEEKRDSQLFLTIRERAASR
ncbi:MAG: DNA cytosine methyltransferase [Verrucomicrobiota bacterium]|jgi:DNA (cytosine-5)-methyltransferase 1